MNRALDVVNALGLNVVISSDADFGQHYGPAQLESSGTWARGQFHRRPDELAQDDTPMLAVVQDVLAHYEGDPILLLQPTQPLREPKHLQRALELLTPEVDSVVSVVALPATHHPEYQSYIYRDILFRYVRDPWLFFPTRRQAAEPTYICEGTCYAFHRRTVERYGTIFGGEVRPLIIDPSETCALDTPADWLEAERRLRARSA